MSSLKRVECPAKLQNLHGIARELIIVEGAGRCGCNPVKFTKSYWYVGEVTKAMVIVHQRRCYYGLTVVCIGGVVGIVLLDYSRSTVIWHIFGFHRKGCGQGVLSAECSCDIKVGFEEWVEAKISAEARPIVCICYVVIIPVDNVYIPSH